MITRYKQRIKQLGAGVNITLTCFCRDIFKKLRFFLDSEDNSSALQYLSERVFLVAILLSLSICQEQGVRKETKDNSELEKEQIVSGGSNFSKHAVTSDANFLETLVAMCSQ
jgi:hypothetical protein